MAKTHWTRILLLYAAGLIASSFLGKIAPIGPPLQQDLGLTLAQLGWAVSGITAVAAIFGAGVGVWLARLGARRALTLGLVILAGAGMLTAAGATADLLIAARVVEGFGYLLVVVAAPTLIVRQSRGPDQATALAIWSTFVPVGLAVSAFAGGAAASVIGWRGWLGLIGALPAVAAALVMIALPPDEPQAADPAARTPRSGLRPLLALAAAFGCLGMIGVVVVALLPTFLVEARADRARARGRRHRDRIPGERARQPACRLADAPWRRSARPQPVQPADAGCGGAGLCHEWADRSGRGWCFDRPARERHRRVGDVRGGAAPRAHAGGHRARQRPGRSARQPRRARRPAAVRRRDRGLRLGGDPGPDPGVLAVRHRLGAGGRAGRSPRRPPR